MIDAWADQAEAKGRLPELVRRLIAATTELTELAVRGADTNNFPGWDGVVTARAATAWVPDNRSRWEMGCAVKPQGKAQDDFTTRTQGTSLDQAREMAFVFVTPRIWAGKEDWRTEAEGMGHWRMVRAYDADDLATWLESAGGVALWLGEQLGVRGHGVTAVTATWDTWRQQTQPPINHEAFAAGRLAQVEQFASAVMSRPAQMVVCADSGEEAVAFACAQLELLGLAQRSACVTAPEGWAFVDAHPELQFVVAANTPVAAARAARAGQCLIVPAHLGDWAAFGAAGKSARGDQDVVLARPDTQSFEGALESLGVEPAEASRMASSCGRSWSVYRRLRASNPAIVRPAWMQDPAAYCLSAIVFVGAWNEGKAGDRACVEAITGRPYEEIERDLRKLAQVDDAPVLRIGNIWKAKAPLELLHLFAGALTNDQLTRFFATAHAALVEPDPALQLVPDKRWMAAVYGHVRKQSGIVLGAMVDSLIKLRWFAEETECHDWMARVDQLVRDLLEDADGERWLSLQEWLRQLAEASPDLFLRLLEASLRRTDAPVRRLFSEQSNDDFTGPTYHVNLLWALEILAWAPRNLAKVCDTLAQLTDAPVRHNMNNRPSNSLLSLLRPWCPQTTASAQLRLEVMDRLIERHDNVAWALLFKMLPDGSGFALANAKPRWRDYDAGTPRSNDWAEADIILPAVGKRVLDMAEGHSERIAQLVGRLDAFEDVYHERLMAMIYAAVAFSDSDRQQVREAVRARVSWQLSYNTNDVAAITEARALRTLFDALAPDDLTLRHAWLFLNGWVELPDGKEGNYEANHAVRLQLRAQAIAEIFAADGWTGIERLATQVSTPWSVGCHIAIAEPLESTLTDWALAFWSASHPTHDNLLGGILHNLPLERRMSLIEAARSADRDGLLSCFLLAAPFDRQTWTFVDALSVEMRSAYWAAITPGIVTNEGEDLHFVVDRLVDAGRHRTAFYVLQHHPQRVGTPRLVGILNAISSGAEPQGGQLDGWRIGEALAALEADSEFPRRELALLQYRWFDALRHSEHHAQVLFDELSRDPAFFMDLVSLATSRDDPEVSIATRTHACSILHEGRGIPGVGSNGVVDRKAFFEWIHGLRQLARERDRADATDSSIGMWLSKCPPEPGGAWPCAVVRELLEDPGSEVIHRGLRIGVMNNRGVHSRAMTAGGAPERGMAVHFRNDAAEMWGSFPRTAETLEEIARFYEHDAKWHDDDAALRQEGVP
ncbi:hypothetical protein VDG37_01555 [Xanthomonas campestris pv. raphani]|uniref:hypothetical protein n=1 Tax=Xanthomonas campestris TaxID=339 RepID=UPI002B233B1D|nr:hypothetical protein [Xanthomonas campestris]MEA9830465.1 hypothetical protein [Xanthomonas campestris pv. raphani]MEA9951442.1 hypothetical protein [Xanthomonas campestris pv. raphani]